MTLLLTTITFLLLAACIVLLAVILRQARGAAQRLQNRQRESAAALESACARIADLESRVTELEEEAGVLVPPEPPRSGLNLSRRSEALRRLRRGETPTGISATLRIPVSELELLGKVQKILLGADRGGGPPRSASAAKSSSAAQAPERQPAEPAEPPEAAPECAEL